MKIKHFMEGQSTFELLVQSAKEAGTNLTKICRQENIDRMTVQYWAKKEPKTILILKKIEAAIARADAAKKAQLLSQNTEQD